MTLLSKCWYRLASELPVNQEAWRRYERWRYGASTAQVAIQPAAVDAPLLFFGPPQALAGNIPLGNTGSAREKVRSFAVNAASLKGPAGLPLNEIPFHAKLYPGQQASVPSYIALDPTTRPSKYDFEITVAGKTMSATAQVTEVVDFRISPGEITLLAGSASSYTRQFVIENAGNVDLSTGSQCQATIFDSFDIVSSLLTGLHDSDKTSVETMVKGLLDE